jgi:ABC-type antimicrobial peptide transport system permease subunit
MHPFILVFALVGVFMIVAAAALLSIRQVIKVDPAVVFRG